MELVLNFFLGVANCGWGYVLFWWWPCGMMRGKQEERPALGQSLWTSARYPKKKPLALKVSSITQPKHKRWWLLQKAAPKLLELNNASQIRQSWASQPVSQPCACIYSFPSATNHLKHEVATCRGWAMFWIMTDYLLHWWLQRQALWCRTWCLQPPLLLHLLHLFWLSLQPSA